MLDANSLWAGDLFCAALSVTQVLVFAFWSLQELSHCVTFYNKQGALRTYSNLDFHSVQYYWKLIILVYTDWCSSNIYGDSNIATERLQNLGLYMVLVALEYNLEEGGISIIPPPLLWYRSSVFVVTWLLFFSGHNVVLEFVSNHNIFFTEICCWFH
jgi:hypothetical protein